MRSLDKCQCGRGRMVQYNMKRFVTRPGGKRYLRCEKCGAKGVEIASYIPRRRKGTPPPGGLLSKVKCHLGKTEIGFRMQDSLDAAARGTKGMTMLFSIFQLGHKLDLTWHDAFDRIVDGDAPLMPVYLGSFARWRVADVEAWITGGCLPGPELSADDYDHLVSALLAELKALDERKEAI